MAKYKRTLEKYEVCFTTPILGSSLVHVVHSRFVKAYDIRSAIKKGRKFANVGESVSARYADSPFTKFPLKINW